MPLIIFLVPPRCRLIICRRPGLKWGFLPGTAHRHCSAALHPDRSSMPEKPAAAIVIRGARQNNLKDLSLELPTNELIVVTGVSGSGKSSLVFDTLYAEGQRRYVETFSPYARQF